MFTRSKALGVNNHPRVDNFRCSHEDNNCILYNFIAIKMLPMWNAYGRWPVSGEIDIAESRGKTY